jgi:antitoxin MazE
MRTRIVKWGNSLGLRIPKVFAEEVDVAEGSTVDLSVAGDNLVIRPVRSHFELDTLLEAVSKENLHGEVETGGSRGRESW